MKIALAQARAVVGDIAANLANHLRLVELAVTHGAQFVAFPELSLTGYEPAICGRLAMNADDPRLDPFQRLADARQATLAIGAPLEASGKPHVSLVVFQPGAARTAYSKQHLHADELPFFTPGPPAPGIVGASPRIGLAICYELSIPAHADATFRAGADSYLASVAKTDRGVAAAGERLAAVARQFASPVLMVNCIGACDGVQCTGGSAVWNRDGELLLQLGDTQEGLLVVDLESMRAIAVEATPRLL